MADCANYCADEKITQKTTNQKLINKILFTDFIKNLAN